MTSTYLGDSGIILCGDDVEVRDAAGVLWTLSSASPFGTSPSPRDVSGERVTDHGSWDATEYYGSRSWNAEGLAKASDHQVLHEAEQRFKAAVGLGLDVRHVEPGFDRTARFRRSGEVLWTELTNGIAKFSAPLWAADPRAYSTSTRNGSVAFPSTSGGLTWPATWPATWAATVVDGNLTLTNAGRMTAWPVFRIDGPVVNPRIVNTLTGEQIVLTMTLLAGEYVTVDTGTHQVLANGDPAASRRDKFSGDWFGLQPGPNTIRFAGASAGPGAQLSATWRDTWI